MRPAVTPSGSSLLPILAWRILPALLCLAPLLLACGRRPPLIRQYVIEYAPPTTPALAKIDQALEIKEFAVAKTFNTTAMVYRPNLLERATYHYSSWRVNPGYMVTDYLARDFRETGLFKAVFSRGSTGSGRFVVDGGVEEIQELDDPDGWKAALAVLVTLLDTSRVETPEMVIFQKKYRAVTPMLAKTPQGLAEAMSRAMQQLSQEIIKDVYQAAKARAAAGKL